MILSYGEGEGTDPGLRTVTEDEEAEGIEYEYVDADVAEDDPKEG